MWIVNCRYVHKGLERLRPPAPVKRQSLTSHETQVNEDFSFEGDVSVGAGRGARLRYRYRSEEAWRANEYPAGT